MIDATTPHMTTKLQIYTCSSRLSYQIKRTLPPSPRAPFLPYMTLVAKVKAGLDVSVKVSHIFKFKN